jgi:Ca2+-binding EF-hand superfamily protein
MQPKATPKLSPQQAQELRMTFDVMDADGNGSVTKEELKSMLYGLGEMVSDEYVEDMIAKADTNRDGKIQFDEFVRSATQGTV